MRYKTEKEIGELIDKFEKGAVTRGSWGHPEHLIVAYHYASGSDFETALEKMRSGLFNLLRAFEIDLSKEMPYHETLTVFWMRTIYDFAERNKGRPRLEALADMLERFDKYYPQHFYSEECLFSEEARKRFVPADLKPFAADTAEKQNESGELF